MKIAIDVSPVSKVSVSAHKARGVGAYINMLAGNIAAIDTKNEYAFVDDNNFPKDADVIHYPYFDPFFLTLPAANITKTVVTVHDLTPIVFKEHFPAGFKGSIKWMLQKSRLANAAAIIADSNASRNDVVKLTGVKADRVATVYLAADKRFRREKINTSDFLKKFNLPEKFLLYVGDATWNKNLPNLIEAVKKTDYKLVLVGKIWAPPQKGSAPAVKVSDNAWNNDLKIVAEEIRDNPQFMRMGFVDTEDLVKIYNTASVLVMPSIYEGFGLPILEAMSCGCPVVTTRGGSLSEVGAEAVFYTDSYSAVDIYQGIKKVMDKKDLRENLSTRGTRQAKKFSIEKFIKDTVEVYKSL